MFWWHRLNIHEFNLLNHVFFKSGILDEGIMCSLTWVPPVFSYVTPILPTQHLLHICFIILFTRFLMIDSCQVQELCLSPSNAACLSLLCFLIILPKRVLNCHHGRCIVRQCAKMVTDYRTSSLGSNHL